VEEDQNTPGKLNEAEELLHQDRRGNPRRQTIAVFTMRFPESSLMGAGKNVSEGGAYFVTSDDVPVEVCFERNGKEQKRAARLIRVDRITSGTIGVAVEFDRPMIERDSPGH